MAFLLQLPDPLGPRQIEHFVHAWGGKNDGFIHIQYIRTEQHVHIHVSVVDKAAGEHAVLNGCLRFLVSRRWLNQ